MLLYSTTSIAVVVLSMTLISIMATFHGFGALISKKKKLGPKAIFASLAFQVVFWDLMRCLTIGMVSAVWYFIQTDEGTADTGLLCTFAGPLSNLALRVPFFVGLAHVLASLKRSEGSKCLRNTGFTVVIFGYITSTIFAILPFFRGNSYMHGQEGFCTYYADDIISYNFDVFTDEEYAALDRILLRDNIMLSVLPFAAMFIALLVGVVVTLGAKKQDSDAHMAATSLLVCHIPMFIFAATLVAEYCGSDVLYQFSYQTLVLIQMSAIVIIPVCTPLLRSIIVTIHSFIVYLVRVTSQKKTWPNKSTSVSKTFLVENIDIESIHQI